MTYYNSGQCSVLAADTSCGPRDGLLEWEEQGSRTTIIKIQSQKVDCIGLQLLGLCWLQPSKPCPGTCSSHQISAGVSAGEAQQSTGLGVGGGGEGWSHSRKEHQRAPRFVSEVRVYL
jgi:hypothetical protein